MTIPGDWNDIVLSVIIPAYSEEATIEEAVSRLQDVPLRLEIIAINDCSSDHTGEILDRLAGSKLIQQVVHQPRNRGKGAAVTAMIGAILVTINPAYRAHELEYGLKDSESQTLFLIPQFKSSHYSK